MNHFIWTCPQLELDMLVGKPEAYTANSLGPRIFQGALWSKHYCYEGAFWVPCLSSYFFTCVFGNIHLISFLRLVLISYSASTRELSFPLFYMDTCQWFYYKIYWRFFFLLILFLSWLSLFLFVLPLILCPLC